MFQKFAYAEILSSSLGNRSSELVKASHKAVFDYQPKEGFLYVRSRAISSRMNDNYDEFPAEEIKESYRTFIGKPVFVNHHNADHRRARGVIIDAALHEDVTPDGEPDTWVEVLMEVDAEKFPKLAEAVLAGHINRTSMGCDIKYSVCTYCGNKAETPLDYCSHIRSQKGKKARRKGNNGEEFEVIIAERCYGLSFFENSLLVEEPADPTAAILGVDMKKAANKRMAIGETKAPTRIDTINELVCPVCKNDFDGERCQVCGFITPPSEFQDPDLSKAQDIDIEMDEEGSGGIDLNELEGQGQDEALEEKVESGELEELPAPPDNIEIPEAEIEPENDPEVEDEVEYEVGEEEITEEAPIGDDADDEIAPFEEEVLTDDDLDEGETEEIETEQSEEPPPTEKNEDSTEGIEAEPEDEQVELPDEDTDSEEDIESNTVKPDETNTEKVEIEFDDQDRVVLDEDFEELVREEDDSEEEDSEDESEKIGVNMTAKAQNNSEGRKAPQTRTTPLAVKVARQRGQLFQQAVRIKQLEDALAVLAKAAGVSQHPAFARLVKRAEENPAQPEGWALPGGEGGDTSATETTEEALGFDNTQNADSAQGLDNLLELGETSEADIAPDATTTVESDETVLDEALDLNEVEVTTQVSGTDDLGEGGTVEIEPEIGEGNSSDTMFDTAEGGWDLSAKRGEARTYAALRLARLRIQAGLENRDDLTLANEIVQSNASTKDINFEANILNKAVAAQATTTAQPNRSRAPRLSSRRANPSLQSAPSPLVSQGSVQEDDEFLFL